MDFHSLPYQVQTADKFPPTNNRGKKVCAQIQTSDTSLAGWATSPVQQEPAATALFTLFFWQFLEEKKNQVYT